MRLCFIYILIQPIFISVTSGTSSCLDIILSECFLADYNCIHILQLFQRKSEHFLISWEGGSYLDNISYFRENQKTNKQRFK
jgi:hypothetical protein